MSKKYVVKDMQYKNNLIVGLCEENGGLSVFWLESTEPEVSPYEGIGPYNATISSLISVDNSKHWHAATISSEEQYEQIKNVLFAALGTKTNKPKSSDKTPDLCNIPFLLW
jgi:hypothetical protein